MAETVFSKLSDDVILTIFSKLEEDPRNWARLCCVSPKFSSLIRTLCFKTKCTATIPSVVADLVDPSTGAPPGGWASLFKLSVCCPGTLQAGVILENSYFGLERELGPDGKFISSGSKSFSSNDACSNSQDVRIGNPDNTVSAASDSYWSLYDLYHDTVYNAAEPQDNVAAETQVVTSGHGSSSICKRRRLYRSTRSHLASGVWNLSREQGNKLLASRFRGDSLYLCDWPGCVHIEERRNYMLFRGVFKNFKKSNVWRTITDMNRAKIDVNCAFCSCKETWDLHSSFCLRRVFGYHEDGDPIVRATVCENGHVSDISKSSGAKNYRGFLCMLLEALTQSKER